MRVSLRPLILSWALLFACAALVAQDHSSQPVLAAKAKPKAKTLKFKGEVISATAATIIVRSQENANQVATFSYTPQVRDRMIAVLNKGGYQFGDKVTIEYVAGTTVAEHISGKPSKPSY